MEELQTKIQEHRDQVRSREDNIISLKIQAQGTPIQSMVYEIIRYYKDEINLYIEWGTTDFAEVISSDQDSVMQDTLSTVVGEDGFTVRELILNTIK